MSGAEQTPGTPQALPDIRYRGDLSVFKPALAELRDQFAGDPRVEFTHLASYHGDFPIVEVVTPFVFDRRPFPSKYRGLYLLHRFRQLPQVIIQSGPRDAYSPQSLERFVDSEVDRIRELLDNPEMERGEILDALSAGLGRLGSTAEGFDGYRKVYETRNR